MTAETQTSRHSIATHRKAFRDYFVEERFEAGIELRGTEVKSLRAGEVNLAGAFARIENGEAVLYQMTVKPYEYGNQFNHEPARPRRLLLHRREIRKLAAETAQKRLALIPLSVYFKRGRVKVELGLCRGKQQHDKRETLKRKTADREAQRAMRRWR